MPDADKEEKIVELTLQFCDYNDYAGKMKLYRKKHKLTQQALADILGVKHPTLRSWEQMQSKPPYHIWRLYKHLFDSSVDLP